MYNQVVPQGSLVCLGSTYVDYMTDMLSKESQAGSRFKVKIQSQGQGQGWVKVDSNVMFRGRSSWCRRALSSVTSFARHSRARFWLFLVSVSSTDKICGRG